VERDQKGKQDDLKNFILTVLKKNAYFILAAAWLFTLAVISNNYRTGSLSVSKMAARIQKQITDQQNDFKKFTSDTANLNRLVSQQYDERTLHRFIGKSYGIFIYDRDEQNGWELKAWNNQYTMPGNDLLYSNENNQFVKLRNGEYIANHTLVPINERTSYLVFSLIPVRKEFFIENNNLKREFSGIPEAEHAVAVSSNPNDTPITSVDGDVLFYLHGKSPVSTRSTDKLALVLTLLGIVFLLIFIHNFAHAVADRYTPLTGVVFLVVVVMALRSAMYVFPNLFNFRQFALFDPQIYSSNVILNSLGDLVINSFLLCWIIMFIRKEIGDHTFRRFRNTIWHWPLLLSTLTFLVTFTFLFASVTQSLISDARISFDVTNWFSLTENSFIGFVVLATLSVSYFFLAQILLQLINPLVRHRPIIIYAIIACTGLLMLTIIHTINFVALNIFVLLWLLAFVWLMRQKFISGLSTRLHVSQIIFWLFIFSVSVSALIIEEYNQIEVVQRKRMAEKLALQADPSSERILSIALTYIDNDFLFSNFDRFKLPSSNLYLKDSLINKNFSAFLNQYETRIYTFDVDEKNLFNEDPVSYDTLNTIFSIEGKQTSVNDLRYFEKSFDKFSYISKKTVIDTSGRNVGYVFLISEPKRYKGDALVPELFKQKEVFTPSEASTMYSFAIYNNSRLIDYSSDYQFPTYLDSSLVSKQEFSQRSRSGYNELWYNSNNKTVIIARKYNYLLETITLFAYLFTTFLLLVALFRIVTILVQTRLRWEYMRHYWQLNIRSQIHGTIIFISLFSFMVIGIATIIFFINRYHEVKRDTLSKAIQIMAGEVQNQLGSHAVFDNMVKSYQTNTNADLEQLVKEVADIHGTDINIYSLEGNMVVTSHPLVYQKGILTTKMNPVAYYYMHNQRLIQYAGDEQIGEFTYQSIYCPVRDTNGQPYAYINIPSFDTQAELKREINNFLVTIINLNAFIFLIAGVIALFITNKITASLTLIGDKMREINLGKMNEEISWKRDDEIGDLVKEYNKMVTKLEDSAAALAKSEREGAWREMARQVAHEIKNPLTPMKLSIQYLQKAIDNNNTNVKELSSNVARTLVEQIDHLSKIAADFSQFANIGNVRMELFDIHEMLNSLTSLYTSNEDVELTYHAHPRPVWIMADKTQMNRLFTNLLQNAVEASEQNHQKRIMIEEEVVSDLLTVRITDNGVGIPEAMRTKIFTPNFTTKSSGTGLGLAMSKTIVEQAKGKIGFETSSGEGTTFYVELPIVRG
jgi:two-component system, NtrC family, nitrogen regulation sensor histidine kinase NtrY